MYFINHILIFLINSSRDFIDGSLLTAQKSRRLLSVWKCSKRRCSSVRLASLLLNKFWKKLLWVSNHSGLQWLRTVSIPFSQKLTIFSRNSRIPILILDILSSMFQFSSLTQICHHWISFPRNRYKYQIPYRPKSLIPILLS